ncbi:hypothetical protein [Amycolatopsis sp. NBC_01286]|uniref:hypothetical protein n=1 Tax=Amycolatopsis sp. NBC_01286 TaxID=2903560 RepID=UPI002E11B551|nr:hypothetical protein OG570_43795 [Amycolatopsis sp. NBC_01286]
MVTITCFAPPCVDTTTWRWKTWTVVVLHPTVRAGGNTTPGGAAEATPVVVAAMAAINARGTPSRVAGRNTPFLSPERAAPRRFATHVYRCSADGLSGAGAWTPDINTRTIGN